MVMGLSRYRRWGMESWWSGLAMEAVGVEYVVITDMGLRGGMALRRPGVIELTGTTCYIETLSTIVLYLGKSQDRSSSRTFER